MSWFAAQSEGRDPQELSRELGRYLRAARVDRALDGLAGAFGCRRFLVRFVLRSGKVRLEGVEAVPLGWGGGPPPPDPRGDRRAELERCLTMLQRNMSTGPRWERGALAYLRDAQGRTEIIPTFDDDADLVVLDDLSAPGPPGHPLEDPAYGELLALHEAKMGELHQRSRQVAEDWDWWEVRDDRLLVLHYDAPPSERRLRCLTLATFEPAKGRFTWRTDGALFPEVPFQPGSFAATLDAAVELCLLATARMGGRWLLVQEVEDGGAQLLVGVLEG
jgi:hypothetical protein